MNMGQCKLLNGKVLGDYEQPYIIAELNSSHNGDLDVARKMIDAAAKAGCDCVKFQSWSVDSLYSKSYYKGNPIAKRFVKKFSLKPEHLKELSGYCKEKGIDFSSTPYSEAEVDFLIDECHAPFVKIASMELNNIDFLKYIGMKEVPVILSTGMGDFDEILRAVDALQSVGNHDLALLHCVSLYPTRLETMNLKNISGLRKAFPGIPIGFSDHSADDAAAVATVALGAAIIEKHFTLDSKKIGMDNGMAMEAEPFEIMVSKCRNVFKGLGSEMREVYPEEYKQREKMRRSVIVVRDLPAGHVLERSDLYAKRPGTGISPDKIDDLVGKRLICSVEADTLLSEDDFQ